MLQTIYQKWCIVLASCRDVYNVLVRLSTSVWFILWVWVFGFYTIYRGHST